MSDVKFGSSPKASSRGVTRSYSDRATGQGFSGSNLAKSSTKSYNTSDTVFRKAGFGSHAEGAEHSSSSESRSSGRGYGASNLGSAASNNKDRSDNGGNRSYSSSLAAFDNFYIASSLLSDSQQLRLLRQEVALDRELAQLDRQRYDLQQRHHIDLPNYDEYLKDHPVRKPKTAWGAIAGGVLGGGALVGLLTSGDRSGSYRFMTTLLGGAVGGSLGNLCSETSFSVQKERMNEYKGFLEQQEKKAVEQPQPQPQIHDAQLGERVISPEQQLQPQL